MKLPAIDPDASNRLKASVDSFCALIEALPAHSLREQPWGPREVLAHLVFWHEQYVTQLQARLSGVPFLAPSGRFRELNDRAVADARHRSIPAQLARFRAANRRLLQLAAEPRAPTVGIQIKADSKVWPLAELLPRVAAHIQRHGRLLSGQMKK